jgi:hypothetical protein
MYKSEKIQKKRADFVQAAFKNPKEGAKILHAMAEGLGNTKTSSDTVYALSQILYISERTIVRDLIRETI